MDTTEPRGESPAAAGYPRALNGTERELIEWVLPHSSPGYARFRELIFGELTVIGQGRRGDGEIILGREGAEPDISAPLPPVFAYGVVELQRESVLVTVRELLDDQVSVEIVATGSDKLPVIADERRRWTYSTWSEGSPCPQCGKPVRTVSLQAVAGSRYVLAVCAVDKRLWLNDTPAQTSAPMPASIFYNELMLHKNIRDPRIALDHSRLFSELGTFSETDLIVAFNNYNSLKRRVHAPGSFVLPEEKRRSLFSNIGSRFRNPA